MVAKSRRWDETLRRIRRRLANDRSSFHKLPMPRAGELAHRRSCAGKIRAHVHTHTHTHTQTLKQSSAFGNKFSRGPTVTRITAWAFRARGHDTLSTNVLGLLPIGSRSSIFPRYADSRCTVADGRFAGSEKRL
uniref:Uncharacterized protein n=1 Tax=Schizaphis graminum TaxID=13262 RepID=A0A2S2PH83_SCHGA